MYHYFQNGERVEMEQMPDFYYVSIGIASGSDSGKIFLLVPSKRGLIFTPVFHSDGNIVIDDNPEHFGKYYRNGKWSND